jgi:hypothetical protein
MGKAKVTIETITEAMISHGLSEAFVRRAKELSKENEGVSDLLFLWAEADTDEDKNEAEAAIREAIVDCASKTVRDAFTQISNGVARSQRIFIREGGRTYIETSKAKKVLDKKP